MNRKIKFRAWDTVLKIMVPSFDNWIDFDGNYWTTPDVTHDTPNTEIVRGHNYILMQFTGLHDKNGKEIYEGDVCKTYEIGVGNLNRVVDFKEGSFVFTHIHCLTEVLRGWKTDYIEVIGNIYQNPELIEP